MVENCWKPAGNLHPRPPPLSPWSLGSEYINLAPFPFDPWIQSIPIPPLILGFRINQYPLDPLVQNIQIPTSLIHGFRIHQYHPWSLYLESTITPSLLSFNHWVQNTLIPPWPLNSEPNPTLDPWVQNTPIPP